jgi:hypothetical protein
LTIDAPTFGLGKVEKQSVTVDPPPNSDEERWLLDPEKPGTWTIAVETEEDRELVPVAVTTPLGFSAIWVQIGTIAAAVATIALGALALVLRQR